MGVFFSSPKKSEDPYTACQSSLGSDAKLAVAYEMFDATGTSIKKGEFQASELMPMASTVKIGISLLIARHIQEGTLTLNQEVVINNDEISPGPLSNPLDQKFIDHKIDEITNTIDELMDMMHVYSDNTASGALTKLSASLIKLIGGGPEEITAFIQALGFKDYNYTRESNVLLGTYYGFNYQKNDADVAEFEEKAANPGKVRDTETKNDIFTENRDVCSASTLSKLISLLLKPSTRPDLPWLPGAAALVLKKMQGCKTAEGLISTAAQPYDNQIECQGYKSGFIGGIRNVIGYLQFKNGESLSIAILSRNSSIEVEADRAPIIAKVVSYIFEEELKLTPDPTPAPR